MTESESGRPNARKLPLTKRREISQATSELVTFTPVTSDSSFPTVIEPAIQGVDLASWASTNRQMIEEHLLKHGALLFRGFGIEETAQFEAFVRAVAGELLEYEDRSSPRSQVSGNVYTSTDHPADQEIFLHNEKSHSASWPAKILFFCVTPALQGGATPIADCRRIYQQLAPTIRETFRQKGIRYVRNFGDGFGLSWQTAFQTDDKHVVEQYCQQAGMEWEWKEGNRLRVQYVRPAAIVHPKTGEMTWFNHGTFFHVSTLAQPTRDMLLSELGEDNLPYNTYYGDGSPIEPSVLDALREAYHQQTVSFAWARGDILLLDNMLVAHGRTSYSGPRKVVVGMAEPTGWSDVQADATFDR